MLVREWKDGAMVVRDAEALKEAKMQIHIEGFGIRSKNLSFFFPSRGAEALGILRVRPLVNEALSKYDDAQATFALLRQNWCKVDLSAAVTMHHAFVKGCFTDDGGAPCWRDDPLQ